MKTKLYLFKSPFNGDFPFYIDINKWYDVEIGTTDNDEVYVRLDIITNDFSEYSTTFWNDEHKKFLATLEEFRDIQISKVIE